MKPNLKHTLRIADRKFTREPKYCTLESLSIRVKPSICHLACQIHHQELCSGG